MGALKKGASLNKVKHFSIIIISSLYSETLKQDMRDACVTAKHDGNTNFLMEINNFPWPVAMLKEVISKLFMK